MKLKRIESLIFNFERISNCTKCPLYKTKNKYVYDLHKGNPKSSLMIVSEAPGKEEDREGVPFVGKSGKLLDRMLKTISLTREDVWCENCLKCRPPNNRDPEIDELNACFSYFEKTLFIIKPKVIFCMGKFAASNILNIPLKELYVGKERDKNPHTLIYKKTNSDKTLKVKVMVTWHPSFLLRNRNTDYPLKFQSDLMIAKLLAEKK